MTISAFLIAAIVAFVIIISGTLFTTGAKPVEGILGGTPLTVGSSATQSITISAGQLQVTNASNANVGDAEATSVKDSNISGISVTLARQQMLWNGASLDRERGNIDVTALPAASYGVGANNGTALTNYNGRGVDLLINVTVVGGAGTVTVKLQVQDAISLNWVDVPGATTAAIAAISTARLSVYPGVTTTANQTISQVVSRTFRIVATVAGNAVTLSVNASIIR